MMFELSLQGGKYPDRYCHTQTHGGMKEHGRLDGVKAGVDSDAAGVMSIQQNVKGL